jgi:hypothetical protein
VQGIARYVGVQKPAHEPTFAIDGIPNCACHQATNTTNTSAAATWLGTNDAATLWELQIASDAMSLDA